TSFQYDGMFIRMRPGADPARLRAEIDEIAKRHPEAGGSPAFSTLAQRNAKVQRAIRPQALALGLFALLAGLASLLTVGQALARRLVVEASDHVTLRSLGMTRRQLAAVAAAQAAAVATVGAALAVAV